MTDRAASTGSATASARVVVVTGAGGGIGRHLVSGLLGQGRTVVGLDLPAALPALPTLPAGGAADPDGATWLPCDVTDDAAVRQVFTRIEHEQGSVDLLVLAAGISAIGAFTDHDLAAHRRVMEVTHFGAVSCLQAALPVLRRTGGRVVLLGSVAGFAPVLGRPAYVAAKHAVTGLFTALRPELAREGVRVTIAHPTFVAGGMTEVAPRAATGPARAVTGAELSSEEVAAAVLAGIAAERDLVLVGRTARLAWQASRHLPRLYARMMTRRLEGRGP